MKGVSAAAAVAVAALLSGGCGTVMNLASKDPQVFGGPQQDVTLLLTPTQRPEAKGGVQANAGVVAFALVLADLPLSLVGDTVTLPLAIYMRQNKPAKDDRAGSTPAPETAPRVLQPEVVDLEARPGGG
jgi:uncharacterized protein YceK